MVTPPAAGGGGRQAKFNNAPPPATAYSAEVALAAAAQAVEAAKRGVSRNIDSCMLCPPQILSSCPAMGCLHRDLSRGRLTCAL